MVRLGGYFMSVEMKLRSGQPESRGPRKLRWTNSKIAFVSCRRFRQVSPSEFKPEVRPAACLFATAGKRSKLERGTARNRYGSREGWM